MPMTPRERVLATFAHDQPDRVPIVLGPSNATGIKMVTYRGVKQLIGVDAPDEYIYEWPELGTAKLDEATYERLHADVRGVLDHFPAHVRDRNMAREPRSPMIDDWGAGHIYQGPDDWFPGIHPLADAYTLEEIEAPDEVRAEVKRVIEALGPGGGYMLGAVHTVMGDVPPENVLAMVDAVEAYGTYPLRG